MKVISVSVSEEDYEAFREAAAAQERPIAQLIREAMQVYRETVLTARPRLQEVPVLVGHAPALPLPSRHEIWDEVFDQEPSR